MRQSWSLVWQILEMTRQIMHVCGWFYTLKGRFQGWWDRLCCEADSPYGEAHSNVNEVDYARVRQIWPFLRRIPMQVMQIMHFWGRFGSLWGRFQRGSGRFCTCNTNSADPNAGEADYAHVQQIWPFVRQFPTRGRQIMHLWGAARILCACACASVRVAQVYGRMSDALYTCTWVWRVKASASANDTLLSPLFLFLFVKPLLHPYSLLCLFFVCEAATPLNILRTHWSKEPPPPPGGVSFFFFPPPQNAQKGPPLRKFSTSA